MTQLEALIIIVLPIKSVDLVSWLLEISEVDFTYDDTENVRDN